MFFTISESLSVVYLRNLMINSYMTTVSKTTLCLKKHHTWYCSYMYLRRLLTDFHIVFHWHTLYTIGNKMFIKYPITP